MWSGEYQEPSVQWKRMIRNTAANPAESAPAAGTPADPDDAPEHKSSKNQTLKNL
jgi:hypothetical protein